MSNSIEVVEEWLNAFATEDRHMELGPLADLDGRDTNVIQEVVTHAKKSDKYIRQIYEVVGFMFKDASKAMSQGKLQAYMDLEPEEMFERVQSAVGDMPAPLDMAPALDDIPDAANDLPSIIAPGGEILTGN